MSAQKQHDAPVRTRAIVIDPVTMTVLWANEAADGSPATPGAVTGGPAEQAIPLAEQLGIVDAIARVASTGEPYHAHADVIPTRRGSMVLVLSVYRLPHGSVLVLVENSWEHSSHRHTGPQGHVPRTRH